LNHVKNNYYIEVNYELVHANKRMSSYHIDDNVAYVDQF
jgi:hypothetical protein